jgi:hypothetical protein
MDQKAVQMYESKGRKVLSVKQIVGSIAVYHWQPNKLAPWSDLSKVRIARACQLEYTTSARSYSVRLAWQTHPSVPARAGLTVIEA